MGRALVREAWRQEWTCTRQLECRSCLGKTAAIIAREQVWRVMAPLESWHESNDKPACKNISNVVVNLRVLQCGGSRPSTSCLQAPSARCALHLLSCLVIGVAFRTCQPAPTPSINSTCHVQNREASRRLQQWATSIPEGNESTFAAPLFGTRD